VDTVELAAIVAFFVHIQTQFGIRVYTIFIKHKVFVRPHLIAICAFGFLLSLLDKDGSYFEDMDVFRTHPNLHHMTYDVAQPLDTQVAYTYTISLEEQDQMIAPMPVQQPVINVLDPPLDPASDVSAATRSDESPDHAIIPHQSVPIVGNRTNSFWVFPLNTTELEFPTSGNVDAMQYILQQHGHETTTEFIRDTIAHSMYVNVYEKKLVSFWKNQGKRNLMKPVESGKRSLKETILSDNEYYFTDLDWWILCSELALPVVLFSGTTLKNMGNEKWIFLSSKVDDIQRPLTFLHSHTIRMANSPPNYSVISVPVMYTQLRNVKKDCEGKVQIRRAVQEKRLMTLEQFLEEMPILPKRGP
jgi:hypothetical protein